MFCRSKIEFYSIFREIQRLADFFEKRQLSFFENLSFVFCRSKIEFYSIFREIQHLVAGSDDYRLRIFLFVFCRSKISYSIFRGDTTLSRFSKQTVIVFEKSFFVFCRSKENRCCSIFPGDNISRFARKRKQLSF